ncbi:MAG TPA: hypothetical protein VHK88_05320 [Aquihabitans sp.]|jgi:hypothetical protein|nr:hypothetical protein [Aquihabitans sp.]
MTTDPHIAAAQAVETTSRPPVPIMGVDVLEVDVVFGPDGTESIHISHAHSGEMILVADVAELLKALLTANQRSREMLAGRRR